MIKLNEQKEDNICMLTCLHKCLVSPQYLHSSSSLVPHMFFPLVHLHNIWDRVAFILDYIIIIISPSPHQPRGCTNHLQFCKHKMNNLRILYSNSILLLFFIIKLSLASCKSWAVPRPDVQEQLVFVLKSCAIQYHSI